MTHEFFLGFIVGIWFLFGLLWSEWKFLEWYIPKEEAKERAERSRQMQEQGADQLGLTGEQRRRYIYGNPPAKENEE